jgi:putative NADH-flavin reductase
MAEAASPMKIFYWPMFGRAGAILRMCEHAGAEYEVISEFGDLQKVCGAFGGDSEVFAPPAVQDGDIIISQSGACAMYVGDKLGFNKGVPHAAAAMKHLSDISDMLSECDKAFSSTKDLDPPKAAEALRAFINGRFAQWIAVLNKAIVGPEYYYGSDPSYVDFFLANAVDWLHEVWFKGLPIWDAGSKVMTVTNNIRALPSYTGYAGPLKIVRDGFNGILATEIASLYTKPTAAEEAVPPPRLFVTDGCPYVLKVLTFLADAKLQDKVVITGDSPEHRAYVTEKAGKPASFPALDLPDRVIMFPEEDEIIALLAEQNGIDMASLTVFNHYTGGVFPRYGKMMGYIIKHEGGWPKVFPAIGVRKVLVLGASGMVGQRLAQEARLRGHEVLCASRSGDIQVNANDAAALTSVFQRTGTEVAMVALGPSRTDASAAPLVETYKSILTAAREAKITQVFFVGGAGSLRVAQDGPMVMDTPEFPEFVKNEAQQHGDALQHLQSVDDVRWSYLSPPPQIAPGARTKTFKLGGDVLIGDAISAEDFAFAALDEVEAPKHDHQRFAVAY